LFFYLGVGADLALGVELLLEAVLLRCLRRLVQPLLPCFVIRLEGSGVGDDRVAFDDLYGRCSQDAKLRLWVWGLGISGLRISGLRGAAP